MTFSAHVLPPLSPVLVAGVALKSMPLTALNVILAKAMVVMHSRHRDVFERLSCLENVTFAIDPIDLPFVFLLNPDIEAPNLEAVRSLESHAVSASIHGAFGVLTALLEGEVDGDALVFSRDLVIEGDTEAVLALRNAVDGGDIHIKQDLASIFGPFAAVVEKAAGGVEALMGRMGDDMDLLQGSMVNKLNQRTAAHAEQIEEIELQMEALQKQLNKLKKRS